MLINEITKLPPLQKYKDALLSVKNEIVGYKLTPEKLGAILQGPLEDFAIDVEVTRTENLKPGEQNLNAFYSQDIDKDPEIPNAPVELELLFSNKEKKIILLDDGFDEYVRRILDSLGHELIHRGQARKRKYKQQRGYKGPGKDKVERKYLGHPDELEAHAYNIAQELLHKYDKDTIINAFRTGNLDILKDSPNWQAYLFSFETSDDPIIRKLIKFIVKYIDRLDKRNI